MGDGRGRYPLCESCRRVSEGRSARHRQVHVRAHGKESCVDEHLTGLMVGLWQVCDTTSSCCDYDGRAYVVPTLDGVAEAERFLTGLGLIVEDEDGVLFFRIPESPHDHPAPHEPLPRPAEDPPRVAAGDLLPRLHRLERRIATIKVLLAGVSAGVEHPRIVGVDINLTEAAHALASAMRRQVDPSQRPGGRSTLLRWPLEYSVLVLTIWPATLAASALSAGSLTWMVVAALTAYGLLGWPYLRVSRRLTEWLSSRQVRRALADPAWGEPASQVTEPRTPDRGRMLSLICDGLLEVYQVIGDVRRELAVVGRQRLGGHPPGLHDSGAGLARAAAHDAVLSWLIDADVALAAASDNVRVWLSLPRG